VRLHAKGSQNEHFNDNLLNSSMLTFYGLAANRQEYCFTKTFFFKSLFLNFNNFFSKSVSKIHEGGLSLLFQNVC